MKLAYKISIDKTDSKLFYSLFFSKSLPSTKKVCPNLTNYQLRLNANVNEFRMCVCLFLDSSSGRTNKGKNAENQKKNSNSNNSTSVQHIKANQT